MGGASFSALEPILLVRRTLDVTSSIPWEVLTALDLLWVFTWEGNITRRGHIGSAGFKSFAFDVVPIHFDMD